MSLLKHPFICNRSPGWMLTDKRITSKDRAMIILPMLNKQRHPPNTQHHTCGCSQLPPGQMFQKPTPFTECGHVVTTVRRCVLASYAIVRTPTSTRCTKVHQAHQRPPRKITKLQRCKLEKTPPSSTIYAGFFLCL